MALDDRKRLKEKQRISLSSPDAFREDKKEELKKLHRETSGQQAKTEREDLQKKVNISVEQKAKSKPEKERKSTTIDAHERHGNAKEFMEKEKQREEQRRAASKQSGPESESEDLA